MRLPIRHNSKHWHTILLVLKIFKLDFYRYICFGEDDPICRSNMELNEVIGQNTCNIEPDNVELECSVTYHGNIPPHMEWKRVGENSSTPLEVSVVTSKNHFVSTLKLRGDLALNNSSYVCETKQTTQEPIKCTSKVMKILYALSDNSTVNMTIDDEIHCIANTSQSCSYKWKWLQDNDFTIESSTSVLKARKPGWHRCEVECYLRNEACSMLIIRAMVYGETEICGLAILCQEVYISRRQCPDIEVYDSTTFQFKRRMAVDGLTDPEHIVSCTINSCLYAVDSSILPAILRIDPTNGNLIKTWNIYNGREGRISIASDTNVILTISNDSKLHEYRADGKLVRKINLSSSTGIVQVRHTVKLNSGLFVVCHGEYGYHQSSVCLISAKAYTIMLERIDEAEIMTTYYGAEKREPINRLMRPMYLSVNKEGLILVSDESNKQAVLLSSDLNRLKVLVSEEHGMGLPWRTCFDEPIGQWFVADHHRVMVCRVTDEGVDRKIYDLLTQ